MIKNITKIENAIVLNTVFRGQENDCDVLIVVEYEDMKRVLKQGRAQTIDDFLDSYIYDDVWDVVNFMKEKEVNYIEIHLYENNNT